MVQGSTNPETVSSASQLHWSKDKVFFFCADGWHANLIQAQFRGAFKAFTSNELFSASIALMILTIMRKK